ncbi:MAG: class I SAM-dependent methyltransferase [Chloroflexi bacterium]|nr:class I SAM-dependent methyltransferase [Chloroflexota bacterium]
MEHHTGYDDFAQVYNQFWAGYSIRVVPILEQLALNDCPPGAHILDLCCGTGQLASELTERGYKVAGVDGSKQMLNHARINAPQATFHCADVRYFELPTKFDIAFSTYDSLNHLLTHDDLEKAFRNVYRQLETGGVFVFDMNLESGFQRRWVGSFNIRTDDTVVAAESKYDENDKLATLDITIFAQYKEDEALWRRNDVILTQRAFTVDEVIETLATSGFAEIEVFDARRDFELREDGRAFFTAKKL